MSSDVLSEFLRLLTPPAAAAALAAGVREVVKLYRARRAEKTPPSVVLPPGVEVPHGRGRLDVGLRPFRSALALLARVRPAPWRLLDRLPPLRRRTSPWRATLLGGLLMGFGIAAYFRTKVDVLVGAVLTAPFLVATGFYPTDTAEPAGSSAGATAPAWTPVVTYTTMAVTGIYSYARARGSNRTFEARVPAQVGPKADRQRREVLAREVEMLSREGWRVESLDDFEAVVTRPARPNHLLHLVLTLLTVYLWGLVWIQRTLSARRKPALERRRVAVDLWGSAHVERLPQ